MANNVTTVEVPTDNVLSYGHVKIWVQEIGPALAEQYLKTYREDYRKFRPTFADGLARDMESGHWYFAADPIKVDSEGNLIDGQHRLHAVIRSGTTQTFLVVVGLDKTAYSVTDTGLPRKYSDLLRQRNWSNVTHRAAVVKYISRWLRGVQIDESRRLTHAEHEVIHDEYVDSISRAVEVVLPTRKRLNMRLSLGCFAYWVLMQANPEHAFSFFVAFAEGENLRYRMPAYYLRERMRNEKEETHSQTYYLYLIFSAWNAYMRGDDLTRIQVPTAVMRNQLPELETVFKGNNKVTEIQAEFEDDE